MKNNYISKYSFRIYFQVDFLAFCKSPWHLALIEQLGSHICLCTHSVVMCCFGWGGGGKSGLTQVCAWKRETLWNLRTVLDPRRSLGQSVSTAAWKCCHKPSVTLWPCVCTEQKGVYFLHMRFFDVVCIWFELHVLWKTFSLTFRCVIKFMTKL